MYCYWLSKDCESKIDQSTSVKKTIDTVERTKKAIHEVQWHELEIPSFETHLFLPKLSLKHKFKRRSIEIVV